MSRPKDSKNSSRIERSEPRNHKITNKTKKKARAKKKRRKKMSLRQANMRSKQIRTTKKALKAQVKK